MRKSGKGGGAGSGRGPDERIGHVRSVSELVPRVGRRVFRRFGFVESAVVARWPEIVGGDLAGKTSPDSIRFPQGKRSGGTLSLSVHGAHAPAVQHSEPLILEKVNRYFGYGAVARIAIRQGAAQRREDAPQPERIPQPIAPETRQELKAIGDEGLRASLEALAAQIGSTKGPPKIG